MKADDEVEDGGGDDRFEENAGHEGDHLSEVENRRPVKSSGHLSPSEWKASREFVEESVQARKAALTDVDEKYSLRIILDKNRTKYFILQ